MKNVAFILSILILLMVGVPCTDGIGENACDDLAEVPCQKGDSEEEDDNLPDECSPFCACHCCHAHTLLSSPQLVAFQAEPRDLVAYIPNSPAGFPYNHFRPPSSIA